MNEENSRKKAIALWYQFQFKRYQNLINQNSRTPNFKCGRCNSENIITSRVHFFWKWKRNKLATLHIQSFYCDDSDKSDEKKTYINMNKYIKTIPMKARVSTYWLSVEAREKRVHATVQRSAESVIIINKWLFMVLKVFYANIIYSFEGWLSIFVVVHDAKWERKTTATYKFVHVYNLHTSSFEGPIDYLTDMKFLLNTTNNHICLHQHKIKAFFHSTLYAKSYIINLHAKWYFKISLCTNSIRIFGMRWPYLGLRCIFNL